MTPRKADLSLLTRAESEILQLLWERGSATVREVQDGLARRVAYTTVLTLVRILEGKGYLVHGPHPDGGRAFVYRPAVARAGVRRRHVGDLVDRLFGGSATELLVGLLDDDRLPADELERLRRVIDERLGASKARRRP